MLTNTANVSHASNVDPQLHYASFRQRAAALIVDALIVGVPSQALISPLLDKPRLMIATDVLLQVLSAWYAIYCVARWGGTPGKLLLKTRIALVDGSPATLRAAALRASVQIALSVLTSAFMAKALLQRGDAGLSAQGLLDRMNELNALTAAVPGYSVLNGLSIAWGISELVTMFSNPRRRALHDFIAGTVVLRQLPPSAAEKSSARIGARFLARLVDMVVITLITRGAINFSAGTSWSRLCVIPALGIVVACFVYPVARWGRTPGKALLLSRIELDGGSPVPLHTAMLRGSVDLAFLLAVFYFETPRGVGHHLSMVWAPIGAPIVLAYVIWLAANGLAMLFGGRHRSLYDYLARTVVVRRG